MRFGWIILLALAVLVFANPIAAQEPPLVILMPGGGANRPAGYVVRNKQRFERAGFQVRVSTTSHHTVQAASNAKAGGRKVFLVGISIGAARALAALEVGAPADAAVFFSGAYAMGQLLLKSPKKLPPTLMVHHRRDRCPFTTPGSAEEFRKWAGERVVQLVWVETSGNEPLLSCSPGAAHGFFGKDLAPVSAAIAFLKTF